MSIFSSLFGKNGETAVEHPCSNCPSDCAIAGESCDVCRPFKEKLIDAIYQVEHIDELRARYVVTGVAVSEGGTVTCPHCGGPSDDPVTCCYCGSRIREGDGKIYVSSASEIPNPILDAQDIIFDRYAAVGGRYSAKEESGLLSGLLELLTGGDDGGSAMGSKMTEEEIREAASLYGVSVAAYLTGLDSGRYLTLAGKKQADRTAFYTTQNTYSAGTVPRPSGAYIPRPAPPRPGVGTGRPPRAPQPPRRPAAPAAPAARRQSMAVPQRPGNAADPRGRTRAEPPRGGGATLQKSTQAKQNRNAKAPGAGKGKGPGGKNRLK